MPGPMVRISNGAVMPLAEAQSLGYKNRIPDFGGKAYSPIPMATVVPTVPLKLVSRQAVGPIRLPQTTNNNYLPTPTDSPFRVTGTNIPAAIQAQKEKWFHHVNDVGDIFPLITKLQSMFKLPGNPLRPHA